MLQGLWLELRRTCIRDANVKKIEQEIHAKITVVRSKSIKQLLSLRFRAKYVNEYIEQQQSGHS
jgi:hypothetical protein